MRAKVNTKTGEVTITMNAYDAATLLTPLCTPESIGNELIDAVDNAEEVTW